MTGVANESNGLPPEAEQRSNVRKSLLGDMRTVLLCSKFHYIFER